MGGIKRESPFKHTQNAQIQIVLRLRKISSRPLLSIHTFCHNENSVSDSEGPD